MATDISGEPAEPTTTEGKDKGKEKKRSGGNRTSPALFVRQVIAELRKVIWPTRSELVNYTLVSLVFVLVMVALVSGLDWALQKGIFAMFG